MSDNDSNVDSSFLTGTSDIIGHRSPSEMTFAEKDLVNSIKKAEIATAIALRDAHDMLIQQGLAKSESMKQLKIACTQIEGGFMFACKSVFKPISPWENW